jgi:hypothetical protein
LVKWREKPCVVDEVFLEIPVLEVEVGTDHHTATPCKRRGAGRKAGDWMARIEF